MCCRVGVGVVHWLGRMLGGEFGVKGGVGGKVYVEVVLVVVVCGCMGVGRC